MNKKMLSLLIACMLAIFSLGSSTISASVSDISINNIMDEVNVNNDNTAKITPLSGESNKDKDDKEDKDSSKDDDKEDKEDKEKEEKEEKKKSPVKEFLPVAIMVLCGLALFLYGMKMMSDGLEVVAGSRFRFFLEKVTNNRFIAVLTGVFITVIMQSSSSTTVMVLGLVNAGLMNIAQTVGVIMGANIGTTATGILISLKIGDYTPIAVFIGMVLLLFSKKDKTRYKGQLIAGFGILFLGMTLMSDALRPLAQNEAAIKIFEQVSSPFAGLILGLVFTAIIQSSAATMSIVIALGMFDLQTAVFIIYGANIGTCITAVLGSIGASKPAKKVAVIHLAFNVIGTVIFSTLSLLPIGYIGFLESLAEGNVGTQIALSSVFFNVGATILLLPFSKVFVKIADFFVQEDKGEVSEKRLIHLDPRILNTPQLAISLTQKEIMRMGEIALENYRLAIDAFLNRNTKNNDKIRKNEDIVNYLNHEITKFLIKLSSCELEKSDAKLVGTFHRVLGDIERIGDHAENIMEFSAPYIDDKNLFSNEAISEFKQITSNVEKVIAGALGAFESQEYSPEQIAEILINEQKVDDGVKEYTDNHIERLTNGKCTPNSGMLFVNMLSDLERVSDHATNIAQASNRHKTATTTTTS